MLILQQWHDQAFQDYVRIELFTYGSAVLLTFMELYVDTTTVNIAILFQGVGAKLVRLPDSI